MMIVSEKSHQNLSDYIQFSFKKIEFNKKRLFPVEKMRNVDNYNYDYVQSSFGKDI